MARPANGPDSQRVKLDVELGFSSRVRDVEIVESETDVRLIVRSEPTGGPERLHLRTPPLNAPAGPP